MEIGRRTVLLHQPGAVGGVSVVRGSSLSSLSMSPLSSASSDDRGSVARLGRDWSRADIDWTVKYLTSDHPRSSPFRSTITGRVSATSDDLYSPNICKSDCRFTALTNASLSFLSVYFGL